MHGPIRHRGPDDERMLAIARGGRVAEASRCDQLPGEDVVVAFAFRRLKIIDLSDAASQPMRSLSEDAWIVFNGEIYNFKELRADLVARGHRFRSHSDTEVILAAYAEWGIGCFSHLEGMWAIVIADLKRRTLVASRDRFGIKPLYWSRAGTALLLASEIRQIVAAMPAAAHANPSRVALHLRGTRYPNTEETFVSEVQAVPPASCFEVSLDDSSRDPQFVPYWKLTQAADESLPYEEALERFDDVFRAAVRSHHVADVGVGSLLSGGLDSAAVTTVLAPILKEEGRVLPTYSFGFRAEYERYSELAYVDAMVRRQSLQNFETTFDAQWVRDNVARVVDTIEEPALAMPVLAQFRVFELCRAKGTTVVLDGQGSDEILAGYPYHQRLVLAGDLRHGRVVSFGRELRSIARRRGSSSWNVAGSFFIDPLLRRARTRRPWINSAYGGAPDLARLRADQSPDSAPLNRRLYFDLRWGNAGIILGYADRSAMAHSIEARVPFFDRRLVELAFSLPPRFKVSNGETKRILRDFARRGGVPSEIIERGDRMGFGTPDVEMIEGPLRSTILDTIRDPQFMAAPCFSRTELDAVLSRFERGQFQDARAIWRVYTLALWSQASGVRW
jgi:asparagine synthase (glutamine-hydrolysing)